MYPNSSVFTFNICWKNQKYTVTTAVNYDGRYGYSLSNVKIVVKLDTGEKQTKKGLKITDSNKGDGVAGDDSIFTWNFKTKKLPKGFDGYLTFENYYEHEAGKFDSHKHGFMRLWID